VSSHPLTRRSLVLGGTSAIAASTLPLQGMQSSGAERAPRLYPRNNPAALSVQPGCRTHAIADRLGGPTCEVAPFRSGFLSKWSQ
jgi:hypothetical protein